MLHVATLKFLHAYLNCQCFFAAVHSSGTFAMKKCQDTSSNLRVRFYALGEPAATLVPWLKSQDPFQFFLNVTNIHYVG